MMKKYLLAVLCVTGSINLNSVCNKNTCEFVVIIPSYNNENYVVENLESVCWQKSTNPYEILYVNDCSTDRTREVVETYVKDL